MRETIGFSIVGQTKTQHQANANVDVEIEDQRSANTFVFPNIKTMIILSQSSVAHTSINAFSFKGFIQCYFRPIWCVISFLIGDFLGITFVSGSHPSSMESNILDLLIGWQLNLTGE